MILVQPLDLVVCSHESQCNRIARELPPFKLRVNVTKSLLSIIQKKSIEERNPMWPVKLPPRILGMIAEYASADLPVFDEERYEGNLSRESCQ